MNICVFCSANDLDEKYTAPARQLSEAIGRAGHTLVWGGSNVGLMQVVADGVRAGGGRLVSVSIELFQGTDRQDADESIIAPTISERKAIMLERSDIIVVMVGGLGTLDEVTEALELRKESLYDRSVIVLNTNGFYDNFRSQLERIASEGLLPAVEINGIKPKELHEIIQFVDTPDAVMEAIEQPALTPKSTVTVVSA